jgi:nitrogen fixation protein
VGLIHRHGGSIILGRLFLNTLGDVIDCTKSKVTFKVEGKEHTIHFPKKSIQEPPMIKVNSVEVKTLMVVPLKYQYHLHHQNMKY